MRDIYDGGKFEQQLCILPILLRYDCPDSRQRNPAGGLRHDLAYALEGTESETDNWILNLLFYAVKPLIDSNRKRWENSKKGGRKPAVTNEKRTAGITAEALQTMEFPTVLQTGEQWTEQQNVQIQAVPVAVVSQTTETHKDPQSAQWTAPRAEEPEGQAMAQQAIASPAAPQGELQTITVPTVAQTTARPRAVAPFAEPEQAGALEHEPILLYDENKYPVTQTELTKITVLQ